MTKTDRTPDFGGESPGPIQDSEPARVASPEAQPGGRGWVFGSLFGAVLLAYIAISACCIRAPFFPLDDMDELYLVRSNSSWLSLLGGDLFHFLRPVKNVVFAVFNWLDLHGGMVPVHLLAIFIGVLAACAVFKLCCRLFGDRYWALMAMAVWLLSPTLVSSTAWLSAASNIMPMAGLAAAALVFHDLAC